MDKSSDERRRWRRVTLEAPLLIRRLNARGSVPEREYRSQDISLAGVYFETEELNTLAVNEVVMTSVSIPEPQRRTFPFTRLAGRGRVVRIKELPLEDDSGRKRFGVAIEFGHDVTALTAIPPRG
jgi:hypothetical protein